MISSELQAQLNSGGFDAVERLVANTPRAQLLRRCSAARAFDRRLYEDVLSRGVPEAPSFDELRRWSELEVIPRRPDEVRVRNRKQRLADTSPASAVSPEVAEVSLRIAAFLEEKGDGVDPERLYQLVVGDPEKAKELFRALYDDADRNGDLARCKDVLDAVLDRYAILAPEFRALLDDRLAYFRARNLWSEEHYRTKMYLERPGLRQQFIDFLNSGSRWIANLVAVGGMGKTAAIRWLISRHCAIAPQRIPVARIDFDHDDVFQLTTNPPRLLLKLARQLDEQIVGTPFVELCNQLEEISEEDVAASRSWGQIADYTGELIDRFAAALSARRGATLFVFDTVEVAMLNRADLINIVDIVARIQSVAPSLRVLFAGRYGMKDRVHTFSQYEPVTEPIEIEPFSEPEATEYLSSRRGIRDDALVSAVVGKSGGLPFKLSLFADIINTTPPPGLSATDIAGYEEVDVVHLIKRIIERVINKQLHWVLRYGAIPRRLTREFVKDVLSPLLARAMAGEVDFDDPGKGISEEARTKVFLQNLLSSPVESIDVDALWADLRRYASDQSWISADPVHPDTMTLHPDVTNPMRRLLERNEAFALIHRMAIRYFDEKIAREPAGRHLYTREAVYHRFQVGTDDAEQFWHGALTRAVNDGALNDARDMAAEITGSEYIEGLLPVRRADGSPIIDISLVAEAFVIDAQILLRRARSSARSDDWRQAAQSASRGEALLRSLGRATSDPRLASVRAALAIQSGDFVTASTCISNAAPVTTADHLSLALLHWEVAAAEDRSDAAKFADEAHELAVAAGLFQPSVSPAILLDRDPQTVETAVVRAVAGARRDEGRFDEAIALHDELLRTLRERHDPAADAWAVRMACLLSDVGEDVRAAQMVGQHQPFEDAAAALAFSRAMRAAYLPKEALTACLRAVELADRRSDSEMAARASEEMASVAADLYDVDTSRLQYERALDSWRRLSDTDSRVRCAERAARIELYRFGNPDAAQKLIEELQIRSLTRRTAARVTALRSELAVLSGEIAAFGPSTEIESLPAADAMTVIAAGLQSATSESERDRWAEPLAKLLAKVFPRTARAALLMPLRRVAETLSKSAGLLIAPLLPNAADLRGVDKIDAALLQIPLADALRICREHRASLRALDAAESILLPQRPLASLTIDTIRAALGVRVRRSGRVLALLREQYSERRELLAMAHLAEAERVTHRPTALELLAKAERYAANSQIASLVMARIARRRRDLGDDHDPVASRPVEGSAPFSHPDLNGPTIRVELARERSGKALVRSSAAVDRELTRPAPAEALGRSTRGDELISYSFVKRVVGSEHDTVERMGEYLFGPNALAHPTRCDLRFFSSELAWNAFPWELALRSKAAAAFAGNVRYFYRARSRSGPDTAPPFEVARVFVVRPAIERVYSETRGLASFAVDEVYESAGLRTIVLPTEAIEKAVNELRYGKPCSTIIHLAVPFSESRRGGTILLGGGNGMPSGLLAQSIASSRVEPLVILDPPLPPSATEAWRQLLMRNMVAAELTRNGEAHSVLAAGLLSLPLPPQVVGTLLSGTTLGDFTVALQQQNLYGAADRFAESIALYTDVPTTPIRSSRERA
jgi:tetratricopeptide (TPR) repeat protein